MPESENVIEIEGLKNYLGDNWVHNDLNLKIKRGEIVAVIGASGCGKTTLLRTILMLRRQTEGSIKLFGIDTRTSDPVKQFQIRSRIGVMFQSSALFSSLTLLENVMFPLVEFTNLTHQEREEVAKLKLAMVGLNLNAALKYPSELSGGMKKRAAAARAIALDPEVLFLDEPTTGLDPKSAGELDNLVLHLRDNLGITFFMITHDLDTLWHVPDRVVYLGEGKVLAATTMEAMQQQKHPLIRDYFSVPRAKARAEIASKA